MGGAAGVTGSPGAGGRGGSSGATGLGGAGGGAGTAGRGGAGGTAGAAGLAGAGGSGTGGAAGATTNCASGFSDDFSSSTLNSCWTILNGTNPTSPLITVSVTGGALHLQAINGQSGVWFQGGTQSLVYKLLTGRHFKVTTTAHPRKRTDLTMPPTIVLHVGGIMARNPSSNGGSSENYVFMMVGSNEGGSPGVEVKSTTNGASTWVEPVWSNPDAAQLRICRLDSDFYLYKRIPGTTDWTLENDANQAAPISRPDLPDTLQVGLALNFSGPNNDLDVAFDEIVLSPVAPASVTDCTSD
jgi:hypothetical protein